MSLLYPEWFLLITNSSSFSVFFAPALDMSFKIYDNNFVLIESIHHDERAIIDSVYDREKDILILSGAKGKEMIALLDIILLGYL